MIKFFLFLAVLAIAGTASAQFTRSIQMDSDYVIIDFDQIATSNSIAISTNYFAGNGTVGVITSVGGDVGKYLKADGTWDTPAGGGSAGLSSVLAIDNNANALSITNLSNLVFDNHASPATPDFPYIGVADDGSTTARNLFIAASPTLSISATNSSYVAVSAKDDISFSGNLWLGVQAGDEFQFHTDNSGTPTTTFDGAIWDLFGNVITNAILDETDPIWTAVSNTVTTGALLGSTALQSYTETDPLAVLADGTRAMSGNLDMGNNSITNVSGFWVPTVRSGDGVTAFDVATRSIKDLAGGETVNTDTKVLTYGWTATTDATSGQQIVGWSVLTNQIALLSPAGTTNLAGLQDVADLSGVADTEALVYDAPSGLWTNGAVASAGLSWVTNSLGSTNTVSVDVGANTYHLNLDPSGIIGAGSALDDLSDVDVSAPSDGEVLTYAATGWTNAAASGGDTFPAWTDYVSFSTTNSFVLSASTLTPVPFEVVTGGDSNLLDLATYELTFSSTGLCQVAGFVYVGAVTAAKVAYCELHKNGVQTQTGQILDSAQAGGELVMSQTWNFYNDAATNKYKIYAWSNAAAPVMRPLSIGASVRNMSAFRFKNAGE